jgi:hypothetical protein
MNEKINDASAAALPVRSRRRRKPVSIERAAEEGLIIARAALVMEVKNQIIVDAIRDGKPYDTDRVIDIARRELVVLARENDESAERTQQLAADVLSPQGSHDSEGYRAGDHPALKDRAAIHARLSAELERLSGDDDYLTDVADAARTRAWAEVGDAIASRLLRNLPVTPDRFYEEDKEARIKALYKINLHALERQAKKAAKHNP